MIFERRIRFNVIPVPCISATRWITEALVGRVVGKHPIQRQTLVPLIPYLLSNDRIPYNNTPLGDDW